MSYVCVMAGVSLHRFYVVTLSRYHPTFVFNSNPSIKHTKLGFKCNSLMQHGLRENYVMNQLIFIPPELLNICNALNGTT